MPVENPPLRISRYANHLYTKALFTNQYVDVKSINCFPAVAPAVVIRYWTSYSYCAGRDFRCSKAGFTSTVFGYFEGGPAAELQKVLIDSTNLISISWRVERYDALGR